MMFTITSRSHSSGSHGACSTPSSAHRKYRRAKFFEGIGWGILAVLVLLASIFISHKVTASELGEEGAGSLRFSSGEAVHLNTEVSASLTGLIARVKYKQRFKNDSGEWQAATYVFPLPENAAVDYLELRVGERVIVGEIQEKAQARKTYQQAKRAGKKAALLEQQRNNMFTQHVANIAPNDVVEVEIHYLHHVRYDSGRFEWRLPTTLTPRYIPGTPVSGTQVTKLSQTEGRDITEQENGTERLINVAAFNEFGWAVATDQVSDAHKITPFMLPLGKIQNPISLALTLNAGLPLANIDAVYHDIDVEKHAGVHHIRLLEGEVPMDRDFVLQWRPVAHQQPAAALFKETLHGDKNTDIAGDYVMLMMLPPSTEALAAPARDMVFVIDTSGSMQGPSIEQAKQSLALALSRLQPQDRFNVIAFNSSYSTLFSSLTYVDTENVQRALQWVASLKANGGTEMQPALESALKQFNDDRARVQQLVFITDGAVGNEQALFHSVKAYLGNTRLFTVGIGSAPNSYFMVKAAQLGRGSFTHIGNTGVVQERMSALFEKLEGVIAHDIQVSWPVGAEMYPENIPDLYLGEPLLLTAKLTSVNGELLVKGTTVETPWQQKFSLDTRTVGVAGIAQLWARDKVEALEDQKYVGRSPADIRADILPLALAHRLVTAYTSFVAVEQEVSRPQEQPLQESVVPNLVAKGQTVSHVVYPRTASPMLLRMFLGLLCFMVYLLAHTRSRV